MLLQEVKNYLPQDWFPMDLKSHFKAFEIPRGTIEFDVFDSVMQGDFNLQTEAIYKIQNPLVYMKFSRKIQEYQQKGNAEVIRLFHDSSSHNAESIAYYNFDWRFGERFKFGPGVYFSSTPSQANAYSNKMNGGSRAMFFADVLIGNIQTADKNMFLPDYGYDTVATKYTGTYVKYYDNEFYPAYVAFYNSAY